LLGLLGAVLPPTHAQVVTLTDASLSRAKVRTFHARCADGRFGVIRVEPTTRPVRVCASAQDGTDREACADVAPDAAEAQVRRFAETLCR
jgi:hypothetical protein